jgi:hypothetical protein
MKPAKSWPPTPPLGNKLSLLTRREGVGLEAITKAKKLSFFYFLILSKVIYVFKISLSVSVSISINSRPFVKPFHSTRELLRFHCRMAASKPIFM